LHAQLVAASPNGEFVDSFQIPKLSISEIIDRQLDLRDGELVLHAEPRLGYLFSEDRIAHFEAEEWH
jgi:hypothetical protein